jgi:hypothetical protein
MCRSVLRLSLTRSRDGCELLSSQIESVGETESVTDFVDELEGFHLR